jgi:hypothetical protein
VEHQLLGLTLAVDDALLSQGGSSTSATGWMAKSNFGDKYPILLAIAHNVTSYLADHELAHYLQWFPGKEESVLDALPQDIELIDDEFVSLGCV